MERDTTINTISIRQLGTLLVLALLPLGTEVLPSRLSQAGGAAWLCPLGAGGLLLALVALWGRWITPGEDLLRTLEQQKGRKVLRGFALVLLAWGLFLTGALGARIGERLAQSLRAAPLLLTAAVALGLAAYLSKKVTGPVEELCRGAEAGRCAEDGPVTELNALARAFNGAQERLAGQLEREREFMRAAAPELNTPLAVLRTHAEALREDIDADKRGQYLDIVLDESDRMTRLVARLLELSRLEGGTVAKEPLELSALIREVWGPLELTMAQRGLKLELDLQEARVDGDRELLRQAVGNLATNALRHCADGGEIRVSLRAKDGEAILAVYNDGELVAEEDLPRLFEAFYRGDKSRSRESGGTGLGLAIVRAAALAHGGGCAVENCECGVCFYVTLPVA